MAEQLANLADSLLATTLPDGVGTSVVVTTGEGAKFPATGNFRITIEDEIMLCTARTSDTLTVTRAQEGTTGVSHTAGKEVVHTLTKAGLDQYLKEWDAWQTEDEVSLNPGENIRVAWAWGKARNVLLYMSGGPGSIGGLGAPDGGIGVRVRIQCAANDGKILHSTAGTYQEFFMPKSDDLWMYYYDTVEFVYDGAWWIHVAHVHPRLDDVNGDISAADTDMLWGGRNTANLFVDVNYTGVGNGTLRSIQQPPDGGSMDGTMVTLYNSQTNSFVAKHNSAGIPAGYQELNMLDNADRTIRNKQGITFRYQNAGWREMPGSSALYEHMTDTTAAHAATAISADSTTLKGTGTTVQAVLEELDNNLSQDDQTGWAVTTADHDFTWTQGSAALVNARITGSAVGSVRSIGVPTYGNGTRLLIRNVSSGTVTLQHLGSVGPKLYFMAQANRVLDYDDTVEFYYQDVGGGNQYWMEVNPLGIYRSAANVLKTDDTLQVATAMTLTPPNADLGNAGYDIWVAGKADRYWYINRTGVMVWGDGTATPDTNLYRSAANTLKTDDNFQALTVTSGGSAVITAATENTVATQTIWVPIDLRNSQTASNAGNSFPTVLTMTDWEFWHWEFVKDVVGKIYGVVHVPKDLHGTPAAKIILMIAANATSGVTRLQVSSKNVADAASLNPTLTDETAQDITVPGTAYLRKDVTFTLTNAPAAGDILLVEVHHEGTHANDSLAVNTLLLGAYLEVATSRALT